MRNAYLNCIYVEPLFSKFSDIFGRKLIIIVGISIFLFGSLLCAVSTVRSIESRELIKKQRTHSYIIVHDHANYF
jgi:MFS family permease